MAGQQLYPAVAGKMADEVPASSSGQAEAPPPYSGPSNSKPSGPPHQTHLPARAPVVLYQSNYGTAESHTSTQRGWTPPANASVAKSRALRRFWLALMWAFLIWTALGLLIGGGINEVEDPSGRNGHWDKHGKWHDDRWGYASSFFGKGRGESVEGSKVVLME